MGKILKKRISLGVDKRLRVEQVGFQDREGLWNKALLCGTSSSR